MMVYKEWIEGITFCIIPSNYSMYCTISMFCMYTNVGRLRWPLVGIGIPYNHHAMPLTSSRLV
jgi:hypothetical protein